MRDLAAPSLLALAACGPGALAPPAGVALSSPVARAATEPVADAGDAADDPAVWVHPSDPSRSLVLGTNKRDGLEVYDLAGRRVGVEARGARPNNVDVAYAVDAGGRTVDVAAASVRGDEAGVILWTIDPASGALARAAPAALAVLEGELPYGLALWRRARDGALFAFVSGRSGRVEQHLVRWDAAGAPSLALARAFDAGGQVEGLVADEELGLVYVAEEPRAIWRYGAEPDDPCGERDRARVDEAGGASGAAADLEGLALWYGADGRGWLIASIQGASRFHVYERAPPNRLVAVVDPAAHAQLGDVEETDGIAVEGFGLAPPFERGLFVAQDGVVAGGTQRFLYYAWPDVAGGALPSVPARDPRAPVWRR